MIILEPSISNSFTSQYLLVKLDFAMFRPETRVHVRVRGIFQV